MTNLNPVSLSLSLTAPYTPLEWFAFIKPTNPAQVVMNLSCTPFRVCVCVCSDLVVWRGIKADIKTGHSSKGCGLLERAQQHVAIPSGSNVSLTRIRRLTHTLPPPPHGWPGFGTIVTGRCLSVSEQDHHPKSRQLRRPCKQANRQCGGRQKERRTSCRFQHMLNGRPPSLQRARVRDSGLWTWG